MASRNGILSFLTGLFRPQRGTQTRTAQVTRGRANTDATIEVAPPPRNGLRITYAPHKDGDPDAGEIVWTWVPYVENDGRGKDRPVLVIGRESDDRVYAVKLTSRPHEGQRDFLPLGAGEWDAKGRPSWVDIDQLYSVHTRGMRREPSVLDLDRFTRVASALHQRYGWPVGN
ncbi:type II toxin-antitoxin system PemK/MazF family toxin [Microbacterium sp. SLBN-146]|uniref:type II toxin-antitoxin system PemK/MazF family toxin n=1 Tax=Microbacterium sp. SLBN-146 TaxID=2768457 RepID=UPI001152F78A|nr:type II toxin-antitoxin system PemK/MazF family toxin [Microbacterium sp. SLBN-146]TQJ32149.1 PemK-like, MazF-like toxin of type II toxin-antitoxin system [Microbacterium sp. SLBN-146]